MVRRVRGKVVVAVVLGLIAAGLLGAFVMFLVATTPDAVGRVVVRVAAPDLEVDEVDRNVATALAEALARIDPSARVEVVSEDGAATAVVELTTESVDEAVERVRGAVGRVTLPGAPPSVTRAPPTRAVRWIVGGPDAGARQRGLAEQIGRMTGVLEVRSCGTPEPEVRVIVDDARGAAYGISATDVADALRNLGATEIPAGRIRAPQTDLVIRFPGMVRDLELVTTAPVRPGVTVRDVATVTEAFATDACRCVSAEAACATGAASVDDVAVFDAVTRALGAQAGVTVLEGDAESFPLHVAPGATAAEKAGLGRRLAREIQAESPGVVALAEVMPRAGLEEPYADLVLLVVPAPGRQRRGDGEGGRRVRSILRRTPGVAIGGADGPARVALLEGDDLGTLMEAAERLAQSLRTERVVQTVIVDGIDRIPVLHVEIDRARAGEIGISAEAITRAVLLAQHGEVVGRVQRDPEPVDIRVLTEAPSELGPLDPDRIIDLPMPTPRGLVRLGELVTLERELEPRTIRRCGTRRCVRIIVAVGPGEARSLDGMMRSVSARPLPPGMTLRWDSDLPLFPI